eukprot:gene13903-14021_t
MRQNTDRYGLQEGSGSYDMLPGYTPAMAAASDSYGCDICSQNGQIYDSYEICMAGGQALAKTTPSPMEPGFTAAAAARDAVGIASAGAGVPLSVSAVRYPVLQLPDESPEEQAVASAARCPRRPQPGCPLAIGDSRLRLKFRNLLVQGRFQMGTPDCPLQSGISVTVPTGDESFGIDALQGSTYDVHGYTQGLSWTRIAATVISGSQTIELQEPVQWKPGQDIVLLTTTWKDELHNQNEVLRIAGISADGRQISTRQVIQFMHYGGEYQAEVALLSRNILFTTDEPDSSSVIGPHTTLHTADGRISGAAFQKWGAQNIAGQYPIHFHLVGETSSALVKDNVIYNSNWRCVTIHGTNAVYVYGNVGFDIHGHCFYLEDGVEERNVLERNLAAYVHAIRPDSGVGKFNPESQGNDVWQGVNLFDPTDFAAAGFYALNKYNTWLNNAASGGFAGFTFPRAPRAIKDFKGIKKPDGYPFNPSRRPFVLFKGNSAHSSAWATAFTSCVYFGGLVVHTTDASDGNEKLYYTNGRTTLLPGVMKPLCPDPNWPANDAANAYSDCPPPAWHDVRNDNGTAAYLQLEDVTTALCGAGVIVWGSRFHLNGLKAYDVNRGLFSTGQGFFRNSYIKINTSNSAYGWSGWPYTSLDDYRNSFPIKGYDFYDQFVAQILDNVTFDNYKSLQFPGATELGWSRDTPHALRAVAFSDAYKPDGSMFVTRNIRCINCDVGNSASPAYQGAFFKVDPSPAGASVFFNVLDWDGSIVRHVQPSRPPGPYLITGQSSWWARNSDSWQEPAFKGVWIHPVPSGTPGPEVATARIDMRVVAVDNIKDVYTSTYELPKGTPDRPLIGYVSQFGDIAKQVRLTFNEGTVGLTGSIFTVKKIIAHAPCLSVDMLPVASRHDLLAGAGNTYWVDANSCLHLKITDVYYEMSGAYKKPLRWDDMQLPNAVIRHGAWYDIIASGPPMSSSECSKYWCPLPGDPSSRLPSPVSNAPPGCVDEAPEGISCADVKCGNYPRGPICTTLSFAAAGYCKRSCGRCYNATLLVVTSMTVVDQRGRNQCRAKVVVREGATRAPLGKDIFITGTWAKAPDPSATDGWPYTATGSTRSSSAATFTAPYTLSKRVATSCSFTVTKVDMARWAPPAKVAGISVVDWTRYSSAVVGWNRSRAGATRCWDSRGVLLKSC